MKTVWAAVVISAILGMIFIKTCNDAKKVDDKAISADLDTIISKLSYNSTIDSLTDAYDSIKRKSIINNAKTVRAIRYADSVQRRYTKRRMVLPNF